MSSEFEGLCRVCDSLPPSPSLQVPESPDSWMYLCFPCGSQGALCAGCPGWSHTLETESCPPSWSKDWSPDPGREGQDCKASQGQGGHGWPTTAPTLKCSKNTGQGGPSSGEETSTETHIGQVPLNLRERTQCVSLSPASPTHPSLYPWRPQHRGSHP
jgi:hypothetical protein